MMNNSILGLHHITAIAGSAPGNFNFYTQRLGLRLVKKTVNFTVILVGVLAARVFSGFITEWLSWRYVFGISLDDWIKANLTRL